MASNSKLVIAATALRLAEQGKLDLDAPLSDWLPAFPQARDTTVDMLLRQRTTIGPIEYDEGFCRDFWAEQPVAWDEGQLLDRLAKLPPDLSRGGDYLYSNANYQILSHIISKAGGASYEEVARREVLAPAGVDKVAAFEPGHGATLATVTAHEKGNPVVDSPDGATNKLTRGGSTLRTTIAGAAALVSTAAGLAQVGEAIMDDTGRVLTPQTRMRARSQADGSKLHPMEMEVEGIDGYGPGMWRQHIPMPDGTTRIVYGHGGQYYGEQSLVAYDPLTRTTVAAAGNSAIGWSDLRRLTGQLLAYADASA